MTANRHATNPGRHNFAERGVDLYETPAVAVHALLPAEQVPHRVWEPACGPGAIAKVLRETGRFVVARDLHDWGCPASELGAWAAWGVKVYDNVDTFIAALQKQSRLAGAAGFCAAISSLLLAIQYFAASSP